GNPPSHKSDNEERDVPAVRLQLQPLELKPVVKLAAALDSSRSLSSEPRGQGTGASRSRRLGGQRDPLPASHGEQWPKLALLLFAQRRSHSTTRRHGRSSSKADRFNPSPLNTHPGGPRPYLRDPPPGGRIRPAYADARHAHASASPGSFDCSRGVRGL